MGMLRQSLGNLSAGLHKGVWQKFDLWSGGECQVEATKAAPHTAAVVGALPQVMLSAPGRVAFSLLFAGARVHPQCGPSNHRLRLHLPLVLPENLKAALTVAGERRAWKLDECLIFDDSFEHSVEVGELPTSQQDEGLLGSARVVLLVDLWHPDA